MLRGVLTQFGYMVFPVLAMLGCQATPPRDIGQFEVEFGILYPRPFPIVRERTNTIPLNTCTSFRFGFAIRPPNDKPYEVATIHYLPQVPQVTDGQVAERGPPVRLAYEPRVARGPKRTAYEFDDGDPTGAYSMELFINGVLHTAVDYEVVLPERTPECDSNVE